MTFLKITNTLYIVVFFTAILYEFVNSILRYTKGMVLLKTKKVIPSETNIFTEIRNSYPGDRKCGT